VTRDTVTDWAGDRSDKWRRQLAGMEAMLAPIDDPLIQALSISAPVRVADVGCGGGATTREVWRRAPKGSVVHGFDVSAALIDVARRRGTASDEGSLAFDVADMAQAAPPADPYERLVSRLGVMFFAEDAAAFANLRRWLAPGGRFAFAVWGPVDENAWMSEVRAAARQVIDLPPIDPSVPGPFRYADVSSLLSLLERAGFAGLQAIDWKGTLPVGGGLPAAGAAQFALASFSSFAETLSEAGPGALDRAGRGLAERFAAWEDGGVVTMPARVHVVTGVQGR
jgi:SAM-dependent methyltransferase